jgi:hypothetical protein
MRTQGRSWELEKTGIVGKHAYGNELFSGLSPEPVRNSEALRHCNYPLDYLLGGFEDRRRFVDVLLCVFADRRSLKDDYFKVGQSVVSPKLVV